MIPVLNAPQVIRRVRRRLGLSQEALARQLNATKGAVQHWERGRNSPDLARLMALYQVCPEGREQMQLSTLIRQAEVRVTPVAPAEAARIPPSGRKDGSDAGLLIPSPGEDLSLLRRENVRLQQKVKRLETTVSKRNMQVRILESLAAELQRELSSLGAKRSPLGGTFLSKAG